MSNENTDRPGTTVGQLREMLPRLMAGDLIDGLGGSDADAVSAALPDLLRVVEAVAKSEPVAIDETCSWCGRYVDVRLKPETHAHDCAWLLAYKLAGGAP